MARRLGKHGFQSFKSRFGDLRKEVNIKDFEEGWAALLASLLPTHQWAYTYLHNTWGGEHCKYWATCYHIDLSTNVIQSSQRGKNTNRWVKALCSNVRKRCCVNKIFDAVERLVKCQMKKQTVEIAKKALPSAVPLVKDKLTTYPACALQGIAARWLSAHSKTIARSIARAMARGLRFVTPCPNKQGKNAYFSKVSDSSGTASDAVNVREDCKHFGPPLWVVPVEERGPFGGPS